MIEVKIVGMEEIQRNLRKLMDAGKLTDLLEHAMTAGALLVANEAKEKAPYRTGNLRRSIHIGGHGELTPEFGESTGGDIGGAGVTAGGRVRLRVGTDLIYARIQEYGGTITGKNGGYLKFKAADGSWRSVKSVTIPARSYLRAALDEQGDAAVKEVGEAFEELLHKQVAMLP